MNIKLMCLLLALPLAAGAEIRRCAGAGGEVIYTDQPCEALGARESSRALRLDPLPADRRHARRNLQEFEPPIHAPGGDDDPPTGTPPAWEQYRPEAYRSRQAHCRIRVADDGLAGDCVDAWRWTVFDHPNKARETSSWLVEQGHGGSVLVMVLDGASPIAIECPLTMQRKIDPVGSRALAQRALASRNAGTWEAPSEACVADALARDPELESPLDG